MPHESQVGSLLDRVPISISITFSFLLFLLVYFSSKPILFPHFFLPFGFLLPWFLLNVPQFFPSNDPNIWRKKWKEKKTKQIFDCNVSLPPLTAYPAMYGPMAHHYGNDVSALTPGSTEGSAHGKPIRQEPPPKQNAVTHPVPFPSSLKDL